MNEADLYDVILAPVITEKATIASEHNQVVFKVRKSATKPQIQEAVERLFNVKVKAVNTLIRAGKTKRFRGIPGKQNDMKKAIVTLEDAATRTNSAREASDLAAAYLVRGVRENRPQDVSRALALASLALQRDASAREALFNRALALDRLSMFDAARQAWQEYLKVDDESGWAAEARIHLQRLNGEQRTP